MVKDFDLNSFPVDEGTSASMDLWVSQGATTAANPQPTSTEGSANKGLASSPIDVEAIDDDVELLSSPIPFLQGRNQPRRKRRRAINLEETIPVPLARSEAETADTLLSLSLCNGNNAERMPATRISIDCPSSFNLDESNGTKLQKKDSASLSNLEDLTPPPPPPPPKEPTFSCPVCMSSLKVPCSTVCGHIFCQDCITAAIKARKQCPNCRRKLPSKKCFHRVYLPTTEMTED